MRNGSLPVENQRNAVIAAIASYRRYDKHNPHYYAELTVRKAAASLANEHADRNDASAQPDRT